ncbi:DUF6716 putative glycosyltransferase [Roseibium algae]|uniref:DUF6716 putative glycosyltransferase n=1 Tax=Roseibium algae TaxID=3123038 RepID=A0ABU8TS39_9HYPH
MKKIAIFINSDSQYFGIKAIAQFFVDAGWDLDLLIPNLNSFPDIVLSDIQAKYNFIEADVDRLCFTIGGNNYNVIGCYSSGSTIRRLQRNISLLYKETGTRPFIFTGYNGVVYEKYEEGIYWRCGYDVICVNGQRDVELFQSILAGTVCNDQKLYALGINKPHNYLPTTPKKSVVFAEQVIVPHSKKNRRLFFKQLSLFAEANPDYEVTIKPRVPMGGNTFHKQVLHPESYDAWPVNVKISHAPLTELLSEAEALLSISSTAYFDAISYDVLPLCIMDFGVNTRYGSHYFIGCGTEILLNELKPIEELLELKVNKTWISRTGYNLNNFNALLDEIEVYDSKPLPPAFPELFLNSSWKGRIAARQNPVEVMLLLQANSLFEEGKYLNCIEKLHHFNDITSKNAHAAYLMVECYEAIFEYKLALEWLRLVKILKPHWKKVQVKWLSIQSKRMKAIFLKNTP